MYQTWRQYTFVHDEEAACQALILAASTYASELHEEIPVYAHGYWEKDHNLWLDIQKANWDDVILDSDFKKKLQDDVNGFFESEEVYRELAIPWKVRYVSSSAPRKKTDFLNSAGSYSSVLPEMAKPLA